MAHEIPKTVTSELIREEAIETALKRLGYDQIPSLRDQFAMAAMQGDWAAQRPEWHSFSRSSAQEAFDRNAELYYRMADSMLKTRNS